jgi:hypothetical protein
MAFAPTNVTGGLAKMYFPPQSMTLAFHGNGQHLAAKMGEGIGSQRRSKKISN